MAPLERIREDVWVYLSCGHRHYKPIGLTEVGASHWCTICINHASIVTAIEPYAKDANHGHR